MNYKIPYHRYLTLLCAVSLVLSLLAGCDFFRKSSMSRGTPEGLYKQGYTDYQNGRYKKAVQSFERLRDEYPLSDLAILAKLGIGDAYYSDKSYAEAEAAYSDFIYLHPTNENLPYVMYQIGMCHYEQILSIDRDQSETRRAAKEFEKLLVRFPNSKFTLMAEKMLRECRSRLAEHEFYVGEFYFKTKNYQSALQRFETIAREYANLGLDYKTAVYIEETKKVMVLEEAKKVEEAKKKEKEKK
ncbi:Beta-barrel assembly machine subunit BamD [Syntrophus gentianae]|uniref:Beta-barrel assembly machine subunit BamD n=1 Tax=Syntrophus gentianae TaxID=43775 RepID=A0A1H7U8V7_9BACT|nr:outer membrane protein assembly factor BamD [Syntrophus gentianae]SEL93411.1 Beta-barrel assembly machine subunit BamD [Syntrophus gentianae]